MMRIRTMAWGTTALLFAQPAAAQSVPSLPTPPPAFTVADSSRYLELGKRVARWYFGGMTDSIYALASEETQQAFGAKSGLRLQMDRVAERIGDQLLIVDEKLTRRQGKPQFWQESLFTAFTDEPVVLRATFNPEGELIGLGINPRSRALRDSTPPARDSAPPQP